MDMFAIGNGVLDDLAVFGIINFHLFGIAGVSLWHLNNLLDVTVYIMNNDKAPREYFLYKFLAWLYLYLAVLVSPLYLCLVIILPYCPNSLTFAECQSLPSTCSTGRTHSANKNNLPSKTHLMRSPWRKVAEGRSPWVHLPRMFSFYGLSPALPVVILWS